MAQPRNILLITVDDLRPELNCYGKRGVVSPNLDRLAARGMRFERAYCQFPQCMPSRVSMLCGMRPRQFCKWKDQLCEHGERSMPRFFKDAGYRTASCGKVYHAPLDDAFSWDELHLDTTRSASGVHQQSFHDYQLPENQRLAALKFQSEMDVWRASSQDLPPLSESADFPDDRYVDAVVANRAIDVLERHADGPNPLFLAVGFYRPHLPWIAPKKYWDLYDRDAIDLADNPFFPAGGIGISDLADLMHYGDREIQETFSDIGRYRGDDFPVLSEAKQRECIHAYYASISFMDAQLGRVLDALERLGMAEDTAMVLWGDNGYHLGEHKLWSKVTNFDESLRVPLIVSLPGSPAGGSSNAVVEMVDVYPTLADWAGLPVPGHLEGSTLPLDPTRPHLRKAASAVSFNAVTLVNDRYRLSYYPLAETQDHYSILPGNGSWELFDRKVDPGENQNVARDPAYRETLEDLKQQLFERYPPESWPNQLPHSN